MVSTLIATALLTITLSNEGHWLAEHKGTVQIAWTLPAHATAATLHWRLTAGPAMLAADQLAVAADEPVTELTLKAPAVRVRTTLQWQYTLRADDDGRTLARGQHTLHVYPDTQLAGVADRLDESVVVVVDAGSPLVALLEAAGVPYRQVDHAATLQLDRPQRVLVASNRLSGAGAEAEALRQLARAGANVMVFEHQGVDRLMGFRLRRRPAPAALDWREGHALLQGLSAAERISWLASERDVWTIELPVDQPALELAWWPVEAERAEPTPIEALVLTQTVGRGRVVLWQVPLGPWATDPRSQRLLARALDYLGTPPGPTPALADRPPHKPAVTLDGKESADQIFRERTR